MLSVTDRKIESLQRKFGVNLGSFLIEKLALYERDFREEENLNVRFYTFIEANVPEEEQNISEFLEDHQNSKIFHTYLKYFDRKNNIYRKFNMLLGLKEIN